MLNKPLKSMLIGFLACSLVFGPAAPGFAKPKDAQKVRVAFWGLHFENIDREIRENLLRRLNDIFQNEKSIILTNPDALIVDIQNGYANDADSAAVFVRASNERIDYIFLADFANHSRDENRVLIVGEIMRYDIESRVIHRFEILKYYEDVGIELQRFQKEYVKTIAPANSKRKNILPVLVLSGVALAGILAMTLRFTGVSATGGGNGRDGREP